MNNLRNNIGKKMPFEESEAYLDHLIEQATEHAIRQERKNKSSRRLVTMITSAAAVVLLVVGIGLKVTNHNGKTDTVTQQIESPIDEFLNSLSDEEVALLPDFEIEEIPEY